MLIVNVSYSSVSYYCTESVAFIPGNISAVLHFKNRMVTSGTFTHVYFKESRILVRTMNCAIFVWKIMYGITAKDPTHKS